MRERDGQVGTEVSFFLSFEVERKEEKKTRKKNTKNAKKQSTLSTPDGPFAFFPPSLSLSLLPFRNAEIEGERGGKSSSGIEKIMQSLLRVREPSPALHCAPGWLSCCGPFS